MNSSIGINAKKQLNSLMKTTKTPKRKRHTTANSSMNMQAIKENSSKAKDFMFEFADMVRDKISTIKPSMQMHTDNSDFKICLNNQEYCMKKKNVAMGAGFVAATALSAYAISKMTSRKRW
ncbi:MAG: hypothetical protein AB6733_20805 [Clostridiaceae bacterium]